MGSLGVSELLVILAICLVIFGGRRLPDVARGLGTAMRNFKQGVKDDETGRPNDTRPPS
jgi:sec-independent protein translocase protein TatA